MTSFLVTVAAFSTMISVPLFFVAQVMSQTGRLRDILRLRVTGIVILILAIDSLAILSPFVSGSEVNSLTLNIIAFGMFCALGTILICKPQSRRGGREQAHRVSLERQHRGLVVNLGMVVRRHPTRAALLACLALVGLSLAVFCSFLDVAVWIKFGFRMVLIVLFCTPGVLWYRREVMRL